MSINKDFHSGVCLLATSNEELNVGEIPGELSEGIEYAFVIANGDQTMEEYIDVSHEVEVSSQEEPEEHQQALTDPVSLELDTDGEDSESLSTGEPIIEVFHGDLSSGQKRRRVAEPESWKRFKNQRQRLKGKEYLGRSKVSNQSTQRLTEAIRKPRTIGLRCFSKKCEASKVNFCKSIDESLRSTIFENFWNNMDWGQKKVYVCSLVKCTDTKAKTATTNSRRSSSYQYSLNVGEKNVKVCKLMFLSTVGLGEKQVRGWTCDNQAGIPKTTPPRSNKHVVLEDRISILNTFLEKLPKMPSHYCRQKSTKLYLEPVFQSKSHLFKIYQERCSELGAISVSRYTFDRILDKKNIALFQPNKDQCDLCCSHKVGNTTEEDWQIHILKKDRARVEKTSDKEAAAKGECYVLSMDLESVKLSPMLKASALYYKTKLCVHDFTVYDLFNHNASCYWWHESEGELVASTFATCLVDFISEECNLDIPIIVYSDGCTCQNRNFAMSNALLHFAINTKKTVIQKYLEKGHTQMECDSVHSAVECKLKNREVHLPSDYASICREARTNPKPYNVKNLTHDFFRNYAEKSLVRYDSIRPGKKTGDSVVTDIRALKYDPAGLIYYKLDFDEDWQELPRRPKPVTTSAFPPLYTAKLPITARKWQDLQDLKSVLPADCHSFYNELPHNA